MRDLNIQIVLEDGVELSPQRQKIEWLKSALDIEYWVSSYVYIFNATLKDWIMFALWPAQSNTLAQIEQDKWLIILKARQLGLSWLVLCYALHSMLFKPAATILMFSKRDEEAIELLKRLKGIYERLPRWMQARGVVQDSLHDWELSNGSSAKSFPSTGGRSYTGSLVLVDEAEFVQDLDELINAVKPTIDAGGQMIMLSTVDKGAPESPFKRIYRAGKAGETEWRAIFLPWHARPGRDRQWYEAQKADVLARTTALDDLHQEYPATDTEALSPRSLDKRIHPMWIEACYAPLKPIRNPKGAPSISGLEIYKLPQPGRKYVVGGDPAEGNPNSDDSALTVVDQNSGEECAALAGKYEPSTFASHIKLISAYYNSASAMVERNNHGHTVILWLKDNARRVRLLHGHDWNPDENEKDEKVGWMTSTLGKALLYTEGADHFRQNADLDERGEPGKHPTKVLHSFASYHQLASIEGATLRAPDGMFDDRAVSFCLAQVGRIEAATNRPVALARGKTKGWGG